MWHGLICPSQAKMAPAWNPWSCTPPSSCAQRMQRRGCCEHCALPQQPWSLGSLTQLLMQTLVIFRSTVTRFYEEVWNNSTLDILEELVAEDIVYKDVMFNYGDFIGSRRLRNVIAHYLRAYPDLRYTLVSMHLLRQWSLFTSIRRISGPFKDHDAHHHISMLRVAHMHPRDRPSSTAHPSTQPAHPCLAHMQHQPPPPSPASYMHHLLSPRLLPSLPRSWTS
jgi:hypothetical protein